MIDLLAVTAHPDDLEACLGGTFLLAKKRGLTTGAIILTDGGASGKVDAQDRKEETEEGVRRLGLDYFVQLGFPDAALEFNQEAVQALIPVLRKAAPRYLFTLLAEDYHPDHVAAGRICEAAAFSAGLPQYAEDHSEWHYENIFYFSADPRTTTQRPPILIDIAEVAEAKWHACDAHKSQGVTKFAKMYSGLLGQAVGTEYAEGLYLRQPLVLTDPTGLFTSGK